MSLTCPVHLLTSLLCAAVRRLCDPLSGSSLCGNQLVSVFTCWTLRYSQSLSDNSVVTFSGFAPKRTRSSLPVSSESGLQISSNFAPQHTGPLGQLADECECKFSGETKWVGTSRWFSRRSQDDLPDDFLKVQRSSNESAKLCNFFEVLSLKKAKSVVTETCESSGVAL